MDAPPISILLVDDDAEYVGVIQHHLQTFQNRRFEVTWVNDGEKALRMLKSDRRIDLVLMDYFLPSTTGVEVTKQIFSENVKVPVILLTSTKDLRVEIGRAHV
jgi:CheY-like chemotaxis protein